MTYSFLHFAFSYLPVFVFYLIVHLHLDIFLLQALLELLDQVEDVISVEDFVSSESEPYSSKAQEGQSKEIPVTADSIGNDVLMGTTNKVSGTSSIGYFLVLEVCFFPSPFLANYV